MFTGIIEAMAKVLELTDSGIVVERPKAFDDIQHGCSIAVSGACLSVTSFTDSSMSFDVIPTTFGKTKLGSLKVGDRVNLERAMRADGRFEGHIVTGHVEGVGIVLGVPKSAPTPDPSPWPSIAYAISCKQGEGSSALSQFSQLRKRVWKGTSDSKRSPHIIVEHAREMRCEPTDAEKKLWEQLRGNKIDDIRFRRQHPIGNYIVDFYSDALKLAIEVDGEIHSDPSLKEYEAHRTGDLNSRGISVMRFSNQDVVDRLQEVLSAIHSFDRAPLTRPIEDERSESKIPGEGSGVGGKVAGLRNLLTIKIPHQLLPYIVHHGSITIDGVALTVAELKDNAVTVALIPLTLQETTLGSLQEGDNVNIETDIVGKYILQAHGHG